MEVLNGRKEKSLCSRYVAIRWLPKEHTGREEMNSEGCGWWCLIGETNPTPFAYILLQNISFFRTCFQTPCALLLTSLHLVSNLQYRLINVTELAIQPLLMALILIQCLRLKSKPLWPCLSSTTPNSCTQANYLNSSSLSLLTCKMNPIALTAELLWELIERMQVMHLALRKKTQWVLVN